MGNFLLVTEQTTSLPGTTNGQVTQDTLVHLLMPLCSLVERVGGSENFALTSLSRSDFGRLYATYTIASERQKIQKWIFNVFFLQK